MKRSYLWAAIPSISIIAVIFIVLYFSGITHSGEFEISTTQPLPMPTVSTISTDSTTDILDPIHLTKGDIFVSTQTTEAVTLGLEEIGTTFRSNTNDVPDSIRVTKDVIFVSTQTTEADISESTTDDILNQ